MDDLETNDHIEPSVFGEDDDDPFALPPPLASLPPPSAGDDIGDVQAQNGVLNLDGETGEEDKQTTKKKRESRPRVTLNEARLCDKKGIAALKNLCGDVTFKGKGHETSDLNRLLQQFEHWAQCLMPRWPFDNVVKKCEKLGTKRSVQNELKRLRRDEDDILRGDSADEHVEEDGEGETSTAGQQAEQEPEIPTVATEETPVQLTDEQMERMRKNRELAFAKREAFKKRRLEEEQSQNEATTEMSERTEDTSEDQDDRDSTLFKMPVTDENDLDIVGAAEIDKEMDESLTGESFQLDLSYDDKEIGETVIDQIIMDTNVNKDSAEQQAQATAETGIDQMDTNSDMNVHEISAEVQPTTRIPFNDDEIEAPSNNQADIDANIEEILAEHPTENSEPVENLLYALNAESINQIESAADNTEESLELEGQTRVLTEKPILVNSGNEYADEVGVGKHDEKTKTNNDLAVEDSGPNPETSSHSDKENEGTIVDETDDQMDTDLEELSGVKNKDTRTIENPDTKNGITENHDLVVENADAITGVII